MSQTRKCVCVFGTTDHLTIRALQRGTSVRFHCHSNIHVEEHNKGWMLKVMHGEASCLSHTRLPSLWSKALCVSFRDQYCLHSTTTNRAGIWYVLATPGTFSSFSGLFQCILPRARTHIISWRKKKEGDAVLQTRYPAVKVLQLLPCQLHGFNSADILQLSFHIITYQPLRLMFD